MILDGLHDVGFDILVHRVLDGRVHDNAREVDVHAVFDTAPLVGWEVDGTARLDEDVRFETIGVEVVRIVWRGGRHPRRHDLVHSVDDGLGERLGADGVSAAGVLQVDVEDHRTGVAMTLDDVDVRSLLLQRLFTVQGVEVVGLVGRHVVFPLAATVHALVRDELVVWRAECVEKLEEVAHSLSRRKLLIRRSRTQHMATASQVLAEASFMHFQTTAGAVLICFCSLKIPGLLVLALFTLHLSRTSTLGRDRR